MSRIDNIARNMGEGEHYTQCMHLTNEARCEICESSERRYDVLSYTNTGDYGISTDGYCTSPEDCSHCIFEDENDAG